MTRLEELAVDAISEVLAILARADQECESPPLSHAIADAHVKIACALAEYARRQKNGDDKFQCTDDLVDVDRLVNSTPGSAPMLPTTKSRQPSNQELVDMLLKRWFDGGDDGKACIELGQALEKHGFRLAGR